MQNVLGFGLCLRTDLALPGSQPHSGPETPDVVVSRTAFDRQVEAHDQGPYRLAPHTLTFSMPGVAQYRCARDGSRIQIEAAPGATEDDLAAYLVATALPALLWLRGEIVLHAAAAVPPGRQSAVAITGPSGIGKSTLLRKLLHFGAEIVADDSLALSGTTIAGLPGCTQQVVHPNERILIPVPPDRQRSSATLSHILELQRNGPTLPRRCSPTEACALLLRNLHRPGVVRLLGREAALLPRIAALAGCVPAWTWDAEAALSCTLTQLTALLQRLEQVS